MTGAQQAAPLLFGLAERTAKLQLVEAEAIAETIGGAREFFKFLAAPGIEEIELLFPRPQTAECYTKQSNCLAGIAMPGQKLLRRSEDFLIE